MVFPQADEERFYSRFREPAPQWRVRRLLRGASKDGVDIQSNAMPHGNSNMRSRVLSRFAINPKSGWSSRANELPRQQKLQLRSARPRLRGQTWKTCQREARANPQTCL